MQKYVFGKGTAQVGMTHTRLWTLDRLCSMQKRFVFCGHSMCRHDSHQKQFLSHVQGQICCMSPDHLDALAV